MTKKRPQKARTATASRTDGPNRTEGEDGPTSDELDQLDTEESEEDPDLSHNAHPLAIRKAVAMSERGELPEDLGDAEENEDDGDETDDPPAHD